MRIFSSIGAQHFLMLLLALGTLLSLVILTTSSVQASAVTINDQSHVLDTGKVRSEAAQFPDPLLIYSTDTFSGDQDSLNQQTQQFVTDSKEVVIGIDTVHRHLSIESGTNAHLSESQASDAVSAFRTSFNGGDYTGATISAVDSLQTSLGGSSASGVPTGVVVAILLGVGGLVLVVVSFIRRRTTGGGRPPGNGGGRRWGGIMASMAPGTMRAREGITVHIPIVEAMVVGQVAVLVVEASAVEVEQVGAFREEFLWSKQEGTAKCAFIRSEM